MATKNVMIDIESLALTPDALVLSIGAIEFELPAAGPQFGPEFFAVPDMTDQVARGRRVDTNTQRFWLDKGEASDHWRKADKIWQPEMMLDQLRTFLGEGATVWANGIVFDIGVMEHFHAMYGFAVPWKYDAVRDARTIYKLFPQSRPTNVCSEAELAHHPLSDCRVQIRRLWEHGLELK